MRRFLSAVTIAAASCVLITAAEAPPKLVVLMVVDQMRADYVDRFHDDWSAGLRRIADNGARFTQAAYPYPTTVTCAGHATISTGSFPHTHGIFANTWFDRERERRGPVHRRPFGKIGVVWGNHRRARTVPAT